MSVLAFMLLFATGASAEWRIDIQSRLVSPGQQGVTVDFILYWEVELGSLSIPVVVRELDPGSFWSGTLPYDTCGKASSHPYAHGVSWNWSIPWAEVVEELRPSVPRSPCSTEGDVGYDGVSPDHFYISALMIAPPGSTAPGPPPEPTGSAVLTITFDVTDNLGQFEFDTACYSGSFHWVFILDNDPHWPWCNYAGPPGDPESCGNVFTFNKGVITIAPCDCAALFGDVTGDASVNPQDVTYMVQYVYMANDLRVQAPNCPLQAGDVTGDGAVNPQDVTFYVQYVYMGNDMFCSDPCGP